MKRYMFVLALGVLMVFAFATSAYAWSPTATYIQWDGTGVNAKGPHADYQTATTKCAVCHSVHYAPQVGQTGTTGGVAWTATGPNTQLLLRSSVADNCKFCHIDTAVGGVQLYGGASGVYGSWGGPGHKGYSTGFGSVICTSCHAVHGAGCFKGANEAKILRLSSMHYSLETPQHNEVPIIGGSGAQAGLYDTLANATASNLKYEQQTVFCSECHPFFSRSADTTMAMYSTTFMAKSHSMVSAPSASFSATTGGPATQYGTGDAVLSTAVTLNSGATLNSTQNIAIANTGSGSCRKCHTAGGVDQTGVSWNSFPHYTRGMPYFLSGGSTAAFVTNNDGVTDGTTMETSVDGNCIMCHNTVGASY